MKKLLILAASVLALHTASAVDYMLDFSPQAPDTVPTVGYQSLFAGPNNSIVDPAPYDIGPGSGITLDFSSIGSWENNTAGQPLTGDGFYAGNGAPATFTLAGLAPGSTVSVYAIRGWNRGALLSFAGGSAVDTNSATEPGASPTIANFFLIGSAVTSGSGSLAGTFTANANGDEGQVGGMIIRVTSAVPEPTSLALLFSGSVAVVYVWRRRRVS